MCTLGFHLLTYSMWEVFVFDPRVPLHEDTTVCGFQLVAVFICFVSVVAVAVFYCCFKALHCKYLGEELLSSRVEMCLVFSFFLIRGTINVYVYRFWMLLVFQY